MALSNPIVDPESLIRGFATLLQTVEWAAGLARQQDTQDVYEERNQGGGGHRQERPPRDEFIDYEEEVLEDGRILRRYANGAVRIENPVSGVMQEERTDGSLVVSLPGEKVIYQHFKGEPLLVYDTSGNNSPGLAQVSAVNMPGVERPTIMFHFADSNGTHLVELESLRYYRLNRAG
ncbi:MAG: hypothetical protein AB1758_19715 [Candidatus Eremiobacterota bacterium]